MSRKHKTARIRGPKGQPTPKNTPGSMKRGTLERIELVRKNRGKRSAPSLVDGVDVEFARSVIKEILEEGKRDEQEALELLTRQAGGVILEPKRESL